MLYRKLGKTGIDLSILGFGCMRLPTIGNKADKIDFPKATQLLHYAIDHGVNFVDTAYFYHAPAFLQRGESEVFLGEALSGSWRKKVHLATKMPVFKIKEREQIDAFLKEQLERLKTGYFDFYLLHGLDGEAWNRMRDLGVREVLDKKKAEGMFRFPAFSFHGKAEDFIRICGEYDWAYAQIQYNYMDVAFQAGHKGLRYAADKRNGCGGDGAVERRQTRSESSCGNGVGLSYVHETEPRRMGITLRLERIRRIKSSFGHEQHGAGD